jgi:hypothetical protein
MREVNAPGESTDGVVVPGTAAAQVWVLEISTWDKRSIRISFFHEDHAHQQAVKILMMQQHVIEVLDDAKRLAFEFEVIEG